MIKKIVCSSALLTTLYLNKKKNECCGIIGILSDKKDNVVPSLTMGVELLKNRGYDSAGIVTFSGQKDHVEVNMIKQAE